MSSVVISSDSKYMEVYNAYVNNGATELTNGFTGVGSSGDGNGFNEGDIISLPNEAKVLGQKIQGSSNVAEMIIAKITDKNNVVRYQPFYPKSLAKRTNVLNIDSEDHIIGNKYEKASGTAATWYQQQAGRSVKDIVNDLISKGQDIKVSKAERVKTYSFDRTRVVDSNVYAFDFV